MQIKNTSRNFLIGVRHCEGDDLSPEAISALQEQIASGEEQERPRNTCTSTQVQV